MSDLTKKARFLARILRHEPEIIGLQLDRSGWANETDVLNGCRHHAVPMTRCELHEIIRRDDTDSFVIDGFRIRAA